MAHRNLFEINSPYSDAQLINGHMTGAAAADMVRVSGDIVTAVRTGTGVFNLTFRNKYPQKVMPFDPGVVGTTVGLGAVFSAWDPGAGTATVKFSVGAAATDPAATDEIFFSFIVRNSGRNPSTI